MNLRAVVLAAGKGTRLQTEGIDLPKVMRLALNRPLIGYVLEALSFIDTADTAIVVGYKKEKVMEAFPQYPFTIQQEQLGTGHAVMSAKDFLEKRSGPVLVCCGDMPLIRRETYEDLYRTHIESGNVCTMLSGTAAEKLPYGRIVRDTDGSFLKMVEDKDCTAEEKCITELNSGVYIFESNELLPALTKLRCNNAQGEYYLTDVPAILKAEGKRVGICKRDLGYEIIGVNTIQQLEQVENLLKKSW